MEDDLPTEYDVIVVGTGMTESIVAAAASRIGKKVLHIDSNEYYGGLWASFNFEGLQKWLEDSQQQPESPPDTSENRVIPETVNTEDSVLVKGGIQAPSLSNIEEKWYILEELDDAQDSQSISKVTQTEGEEQGKEDEAKVEKPESDEDKKDVEDKTDKPDAVDGKEVLLQGPTKQWSQSKLRNEYRKFNLDLAPKLLFARGSLVELLISSNIARYAEFRSVTRVLTWLNGRLEPVPCSRADVFATHHVTVVEKRMLMKLLTVCMEFENSSKEFEGFEDKLFVDYLMSKKLTPNLLHYVLYAIAMASDTTPCMEGVARTQRFLNSLGRYGNTPFLWPMYGSGELPQCFCRLCAVFGGLYHLKRTADYVVLNKESADDSKAVCKGIVSGRKYLETSHLVMGVGYAPTQFLPSTQPGGVSRGIFITDRSIMPADKESLTLLQFPPIDGVSKPVTVIEVGPSTNACPPGLYIVHMTCQQNKTAKEDLQSVVEHLLHMEFSDGSVNRVVTETQSTQTVSPNKKQSEVGEGEEAEKKGNSDPVTALKPQVLWSLFFNSPETSQSDLTDNVPQNVYLCSGPDLDLDFEFAVKQAKEIFSKMYPDNEFLPRAPDPEEIVLEGEESAPGPTFEGDTKSDKEDESTENKTETGSGDATEAEESKEVR